MASACFEERHGIQVGETSTVYRACCSCWSPKGLFGRLVDGRLGGRNMRPLIVVGRRAALCCSQSTAERYLRRSTCIQSCAALTTALTSWASKPRTPTSSTNFRTREGSSPFSASPITLSTTVTRTRIGMLSRVMHCFTLQWYTMLCLVTRYDTCYCVTAQPDKTRCEARGADITMGRWGRFRSWLACSASLFVRATLRCAIAHDAAEAMRDALSLSLAVPRRRSYNS